MLLPKEQSSWNCGYFLGAIALQALDQCPKRRADLAELQRCMSELSGRPISPTQVIAAATWLFLLGLVGADDDGAIARCD